MWRAGRLPEAEASLREGIALMRRGLTPDHPDVGYVYSTLAAVLNDRKDGPGAETAIREALRIRQKALGNDHRDTAASRIDLGLNLLARHTGEVEARSLLQQGVKVLAEQAGEDDARVKKARAALVAPGQ
jgi:hypothetical protein